MICFIVLGGCDSLDTECLMLGDNFQVENMPQNAQPDINIEHHTTGKLKGNIIA